MKKLKVLFQKDFALCLKDRVGLALLFVMPIFLTLVMIALQDASFEQIEEQKIPIVFVNEDQDLLGNAMQDSIKQLMQLYMLPQDIKGIQMNSDKLTSYIWDVYSYLGSSDGAPNQMAQFATGQLKKEAVLVIGKLNDFFTKDWKAYQAKVEAARAPKLCVMKTVESCLLSGSTTSSVSTPPMW